MRQTATLKTTENRVHIRERHRSSLITSALSMLRIGLIGFGGGSALIPVIEEEAVDEAHLVDRKDYDEAVVCACVTPGALPVEIAAGIGKKTHKIPGMLLFAAFMALPGAVITVILLSILSGSSDASLNVIRYLSIGISAFIISMLLRYGLQTAGNAAAESRRSLAVNVIIMVLVFSATGLQGLVKLFGASGTASHIIRISTVQVLLIAFAILILWDRIQAMWHPAAKKAESGKKTEKIQIFEILKESLAWLMMIAVFSVPFILLTNQGVSFVIRGFLSSILSFGGGDAYLTVADGLFVQGNMISSDTFYSMLVPVINVLPGSILTKTLTGIGYFVGADSGGTAMGIAGAAAGFAVSVAASGLTFGIVFWLFKTFENVTIFQTISRWIRPIVSGLLFSVAVTMMKTVVQTAGTIGVGTAPAALLALAITAVDLVLLQKKVNCMIPLALSAGIGSFVLVLI